MSEASTAGGSFMPGAKAQPKRSFLGRYFPPLFCIAIWSVILAVTIGTGRGVKVSPLPYRIMQNSRSISIALFEYANNHDQAYPDGKNSTEVFQKLIDGGYVTDPSIFYIPMAGKTPPTAGQPLKSENVCFDVTTGTDASTPNTLPLVFSTGYRVTYLPGSSAVPLKKAPAYYGGSPSTIGIAVCYKSNTSYFLKQPTPNSSSDGSIPNFIPADFDAHGVTYRQLTPDGVLTDK